MDRSFLNPKKIEIPLALTYKLDAMWKAASALQNPELGRKTILIAGTNGKGSTASMLSALLMQAGLKVGTFSSPHVVHRGERIRIQQKPVTEALLLKYEKKYRKVLEPLTYFERHTVLGFLIFRDRKVDVQVLEVGMGARLDATNISDPDLSILTSVDLDHEDILGNTVTQIAQEKLGVLRNGRALILQKQDYREVEIVARKRANRENALVIYSHRDPALKKCRPLLDKIEKDLGAHQKKNAQTALSAFFELQKIWGLRKLRSREMEKAFQNFGWPARMDFVRKSPVFLVDGAHNLHAIRALARVLKAKRLKNFHLFFGAMADKHQKKEILKTLAPFFDRISLPEGYYPEREEKALRLLSLIPKNVPAEILSSPAKLRSAILKAFRTSKKPVLVAGSFYLAGEVLKILKR